MRNGTMQRSRSRVGLRLVESRPQAKRTKVSATDYYSRIEGFARRIRETEDVASIIVLLEEALRETRALHTETEVTAARQQLITAERRIEYLKCELELVNQLVREDQLTGALNRRGLDDAFAREASRADRRGTALCVALIDLDNFKQLNDRHGHQAGDGVLMHMVGVVQDAIRGNDFIGRYGGEEFLLVLPDSELDHAVAVMRRLQEGLQARPFCWDDLRLRVTFSAGVAERRAGEEQSSLVARADNAMYEAKRAGKDRVVVAR